MPLADFMLAWENSWPFMMLPLVFSTKWRPGNGGRNSILMTCHYLGLSLWSQTYFRLSLLSIAGYPELGIASDWSCHMANLLQPIRRTTQIWVMMHHQRGISVLVSQMAGWRENQSWRCIMSVVPANKGLFVHCLFIWFCKWRWLHVKFSLCFMSKVKVTCKESCTLVSLDL